MSVRRQKTIFRSNAASALAVVKTLYGKSVAESLCFVRKFSSILLFSTISEFVGRIERVLLLFDSDPCDKQSWNEF